MWTKIYNKDVEDEGYSVQQTADGGFVITGSTGPEGPGPNNVYLLRTDSNGDTLWTKTFIGGEGHSVQQMNDGGFIVAGFIGLFSDDKSDVYLIRTDANGDTLWTKTCGGAEDERGYSVRQTIDGGFIITGTTTSFGSGGADVYLIRLDKESVGIQDDNHFNSLRPNNLIVSSYQGNISIRYTIPFSNRIKLEAFNIKGRLVEVIEDRFMQKGSYSVKWDADRFGAGVYYVKLSVGGNSLVRKAVIMK